MEGQSSILIYHNRNNSWRDDDSQTTEATRPAFHQSVIPTSTLFVSAPKKP